MVDLEGDMGGADIHSSLSVHPCFQTLVGVLKTFQLS